MYSARPDQIDHRANPYGARVVAYADHRCLAGWLSRGFKRGRYCKIKRGYAVIRPALKKGKRPKLTDEQLAYADATKRELRAMRARIKSLPAELGVCAQTLHNALCRWRKRRSRR